MTVQRETTTILTTEQREKFDRDGYIVLDDTGCPESLLDGIVADLEGKFEGDYHRAPDGVHYSWHRIMDAWMISPRAKSLALSPKILAILEELYERKPLPFQTLNFRQGTQQPTHSDTVHFNSMPAGYMCGVWVALEEMDMDNGPVVYYPGSHKLPEVTLKDVGPGATEDDYSRYIVDLIEREGLEPHYATIRKGQAFVWAANLLHGGSPQRDMNRTRYSQVTHFFFEDCKYWSPILSDEDHIEWRHPVWITEGSDDANQQAAARIREAVSDAVPEGATVLVASRGDDELVELEGRRGWHFPRDEEGAWAGHYPADGAAAIAHVEELRAKGAGYLVLPSAALWWLDHYPELRRYLDEHCPALADEPDVGRIFELPAVGG